MNFQTHYSRMLIPYEQRICEAHPGGGKSLTVPDMTLPLRTLVERFVQKREVPVAPDGVYLEDDSVLNDFYPENMDMEERLEFAAAVGSAISDEMDNRRKPKPASDPVPAPTLFGDDIAGI